MSYVCYTRDVKQYIHARLTREERVALEELKRATGQSESALVRRGLRLVADAARAQASALALAGSAVGRYRGGPPDLSTSDTHLDGFGT